MSGGSSFICEKTLLRWCNYVFVCWLLEIPNCLTLEVTASYFWPWHYHTVLDLLYNFSAVLQDILEIKSFVPASSSGLSTFLPSQGTLIHHIPPVGKAGTGLEYSPPSKEATTDTALMCYLSLGSPKDHCVLNMTSFLSLISRPLVLSLAWLNH